MLSTNPDEFYGTESCKGKYHIQGGPFLEVLSSIFQSCAATERPVLVKSLERFDAFELHHTWFYGFCSRCEVWSVGF
eukprot:3937098-Rhodomonas_salina.3